MRLRKGQICPIHRSRKCCGRDDVPAFERRSGKWETVRPGWRRIKDETNSRGYRYRLSPAEMRKVLDRKIEDQNQMCGICGFALEDYNDVAPDHKEPKGLGGARRDDHPDNIQAAHSRCNIEKGSQRI